MEDPFLDLIQGLHTYGERNAFCMDGRYHTYQELDEAVGAIRQIVRQRPTERIFGLADQNGLSTYASILALWAEGRAYVPLAPGTMQARNQGIVEQAGVRTVLCAGDMGGSLSVDMVRTDLLPPCHESPPPRQVAGTENAYLLFTSGTTGKPKGVPIHRDAVAAFVQAFDALGLDIGPEDRCLQMFDLTFDLSVMSYMVPLLKGACIYPVAKDAIKYLAIHELLEDHDLTVALMVPSMLNFLRPYFDEIACPALRANLFCGEALPLDIVEEWSARVPNARILNVYGPTEHTIFCTVYEYLREGRNKHHNGILSIGRPMAGTTVTIIDEEQRTVPPGTAGELCLGGPQGTAGYWENPAKNAESFIYPKGLADGLRYYRTGDRCVMDAEGDLLYLGRTDHQVQVQGFRVELGEIEYQAKSLLEKRNLVVAAINNARGNTELMVVTEGEIPDPQGLIKGLRELLPAYMIPARVHHMDVLPLNANGKIDRPAVSEWLRTKLT